MRRRDGSLVLLGAMALLMMVATTAVGSSGTPLKDVHAGAHSTMWVNGSASDRDGIQLEDGEVLGHFVLTSGTALAIRTLMVSFASAGQATYVADLTTTGPSGFMVLHGCLITPTDDTLSGASTDADGRNLVLSHVCRGGTVPIDRTGG